MNPNDLLARLRDWWHSLETKRKVAYTITISTVLIAILFFLQILMTTKYEPLFSQLDPVEAGAIVEELESMNIPYRLTDDGKCIEVPQEMVHSTRIKLASAGVLVGAGKGFELFDDQKFGITDFEQQVGYQRALQEELRRTIVQLNEVEQARVHLVIPEKSIFSDNNNQPSAAVALQLKRGATLESQQVHGIADLIVGSVEGMQKENIHIIDMNGNVLSNFIAQDTEGFYTVESVTRQQLKRNYEQELESRIHKMLSQIFGPGAAVAMVTAELNFDQRHITSTSHGPGQIISEQIISEEGTGLNPAGPGGVDGEFGFPAWEEGIGDTYSRDEQITNYQPDTYNETIIKSPGDVKRLSVALVINEAALGVTGDFEIIEQQLAQVQNLIASAIGYDSTRGDQITVSSMTFDSSFQDLLVEEPMQTESIFDQVNPLVLIGIAAALIFLLALFLIIRRRRSERLAQIDDQIDAEEKTAEIIEKTQPVEQAETKDKQKLRRLAKEKPGDVAEILKLWLKE